MVGFPAQASSAISSMLAPASPRSRKTRRAASRMRDSTSPASSRGGRPVRTAAPLLKRRPVRLYEHPVDIRERTMALEAQKRDWDLRPLLERSGQQQVRSLGRPPSENEQRTASARGRAPAPRERPAEERRIVEAPLEREDHQPGQDREGGDEPRTHLLRRHPMAFLLGLVLFTAAAGSGYLYWDYAEHFQSTDDAFIAARQFAIAPKVAGYVTAVPVTDNQHVNAGDVIARIDERDYRIALDQAQAQVASAQAGIQNIDAQLNVQ